MAETAKPKPRRKNSPRKTAPKAAAQSKKVAEPEPEPTSAADIESNGEHVKITPPDPAGKSGGAWFLLVLLILVSAGAGYLTWPRWQPYVAAYLPAGFALAVEDPRVAGLSARIGELESQTEALRQKDEVIAKLEDERLKLRDSLSGVLERIESIEHSITAVKEMAKAAATAEEAAAASRSLQALKDRLSKIEKIPPAAAGAGAPELTSRLAQLERDRTIARDLAKRIAMLEESGAQSRKNLSETLAELNASRTSLSALEGRISAVESRPAVGGEATSVIVLAVSELRDAVHRGRAFTNELDAVRAAGAGDPAIEAALATLGKNAAKGIATLSELRSAFSTRAGDIAAAGQGAQEADWIDRAVSRMSSLVRLRRIDGTGETASAETLVSQAEKHLAAGDLTAATRTIEKLGGEAGAAAAPWLSRAKARLSAEQSLAGLHALAVSMLTAPKG